MSFKAQGRRQTGEHGKRTDLIRPAAFGFNKEPMNRLFSCIPGFLVQ
jgi:hypothetical protein